MKVSLRWLRDFVTLPPEVTPAVLAEHVTRHIAEVDGLAEQGQGLERVVVGLVTEVASHPAADRLGVATIDVGGPEELTIVFGKVLPLQAGDRVPVALAPCALPTGIEVRSGEIRGVKSAGMVCVDEELGLALGGLALDDPRHPGEQIHLTSLPGEAKPGTPLAELLHLDDTVLEIDNVALTHRPDLWGHYGLAREVAAAYGVALAPLKAALPAPRTGSAVPVMVETPLCNRYVCARLEHLAVEPSPRWLQARLEAVGIRPINNVVDATNYVMAELGQPLHAFDAAAVGASGITVRESLAGEQLQTLDGASRELLAGSVVIASEQGIVALAGIMGGAASQITPATTAVLLESANFDAVAIRRAATALRLRTEASARFEKGLDPALAPQALARLVALLKQLCPKAVVSGPVTDAGERREHPPYIITFDPQFVADRLGMAVGPAEFAAVLKPLGFSLKKAKGGHVEVAVPHWRAGSDVSMPEDLVEEVGRRIGYDRIVPQLPARPMVLPIVQPVQRLGEAVRRALADRYGFTETLSYSFALPSPLPRESGLELANPPAPELATLRASLLPNVMSHLAKNARQSSQLALFEIGRIFKPAAASSHEIAPGSSDHLPAQPRRLAAAIIHAGTPTTLFRELKGVIGGVLEAAGYQPSWLAAAGQDILPAWAEASETIVLTVAGEVIGFVAVVPERLLQPAKLRYPVAAAELDLSKLSKVLPSVPQYRPIPRYPSIVEDISMLAPQRVRWAEVEKVAAKFNPLITSVELFDVYEGGKLGQDKRSLAFHVTFSSSDRTLTDDEVQPVVQQLGKELTKKFNAEIR